jgi:hypothetical protein
MAGTGRIVIAVLLVALVGVGAYFGIAALMGTNDETGGTTPSVERVLSDTDSLVGKRVTVHGNVQIVLDPRAVLLGANETSDTGLLVVSQSGKLPKWVQDNARMTAVGRVARFSPVRFRKEHPGVSADALARSPLSGLENHPSVTATVIVPG